MSDHAIQNGILQAIFSSLYLCDLVSILSFSLGTPAPPEKPPRLTAQVATMRVLVACRLSWHVG